VAVAFRSSTSNSGSGAGPITVNVPAGVASGDRVLIFMRYLSLSGTKTFTWPSGFHVEKVKAGFSANELEEIYVGTKVATGSEGSSYSISISASVSEWAAWAVATNGAALVTNLSEYGYGNPVTAGTVMTVPGVYTSANGMLLALFQGDASVPPTPSGMTSQATAGAWRLVTETKAAAGKSADKTSTVSHNEAGALMVGLSDPLEVQTPVAQLLLEMESTTDASSYVTSSFDQIQPGPNRLVFCTVSIGHATAAPAISSVTGLGLTWVLAGERVSADSSRRTAIYRAMGASPTLGQVTVTLASGAENCAIRIVEFTGTSTVGSNGQGAVRQLTTGAGTGSSKSAGTLAGALRPNSITFGAFNANTSSDVPSPGAGFEELGFSTNTNPGSPSTRLFNEWSYGGTNPIVATGGGGATWEGVGVEVVSVSSNTRTISAAGGNWNATTAWVEGAIPATGDNVTVLPSSGTSTINVSMVVGSVDLTGYVATLNHSSSVTLTVEQSLNFSGSWTYTRSSTSTSAITFAATTDNGGAGWPITGGGKTFGNVTFDGTGGRWTLQDTFNVHAASGTTLTLTRGHLNTNGQIVNAGVFSSTNTNTRALTLGSSTINISGASWNFATVTNLTVAANTATVELDAANGSFITGNFNWNGLSVAANWGPGTNSVVASSGATIANLTVAGAGQLFGELAITGSITVTGTFTSNGISPAVNRILVRSNSSGVPATITAAVVSVSNTDFADIVAAGAGSWNLAANSVGNAGGNTGITFTTPVTRYARSVGGNWSSTTTWASTSGGGAGASVPIVHDTVILDAATGSATVTTDGTRLPTITATGFTGTLNMNSTQSAIFSFFGSLTLAAGMTFNNTGSAIMTFQGRGSHTITMAGKSFGTGALIVSAPGGTYTLQDAFTAGGSFTLQRGTWATNGQTFTVTAVSSTGTETRAFNFGASTVNLTNTAAANSWFVSGTGITVTAGSSTIAYSTASANTRGFVGGGMTYGKLQYTVAASTGQLTVDGSNTFGEIEVTGGARTLAFTAGTTNTLTTWNVNGTGSYQVTVRGTTASRGTVAKAGGGVAVGEFLTVQDMAATPATTFFADPGGVDSGNNTGWTFGPPSFPQTVTQTTGIPTAQSVPSPAVLVEQFVTVPSIATAQSVPSPTVRIYVTNVGNIASRERVRTNLLDPQVSSFEDGTTSGVTAFNSGATLFNALVGGQNLLDLNNQSFETSFTWTNFSPTCTVVRSTAQAYHGVASALVTLTSNGTVNIKPPNVAITPMRRYGATAMWRAGGTTRNVAIDINWRDAGGSIIGTTPGTPVAATSAGWVEARVEGDAPFGAVFATPQLDVNSGLSSETFYFDHVFFGLTENQEASGLGTRSLGVIFEGGIGGGTDRGLQTATIPLEIGQVYTFSLAVNIPDAMTNAPQLAMFGGVAVGDNRIAGSLPTSTVGWQRYGYTFQAVTSTAQFRITYGSMNIAADEPPMFTDGWMLTEVPSHGNVPIQDVLFTNPNGGDNWAGNNPAGTAPSAIIASSQGIRLGGSGGAYISTPDHADFNFGGDVTLEWYGSFDNWQLSGTFGLVGKWTSTVSPATSEYLLTIINGIPNVFISNGSAAGNAACSANVNTIPGYVSTGLYGIKVTWRQSDGRIQFFWTTDPDGVNWTQLGNNGTNFVGYVTPNTAQNVNIGSFNNGSGLFPGVTKWAKIRNGIDGTVVLDFNAATAAPTTPKLPTSTAQGGKTFTVNGTNWAWTFARWGPASLAFQANSTSNSDALLNTNAVAVPGREYFIGAWVRSSVARSVSVWTDFHGSAGYISTPSHASFTTDPTQWVYIWNRAVAPPGATRLIPLIGMSGQSAGEIHFFDAIDVHTYEVSGDRVEMNMGVTAIPTSESVPGGQINQVIYQATATTDGIASAESWGNLLTFDQATNEAPALKWFSNQGGPAVALASDVNLLTLNQATAETDLTGIGGFRATIARVSGTPGAVYGVWAFRATTNQTTQNNWGTSSPGTSHAVPVVPGDTLSAVAYATRGQGNHTVALAFDLYDAGGGYIGGIYTGTPVVLSASPQLLTVTGKVTLANAAFAYPTVRANAIPASGDYFDVDGQAVYRGAPIATFIPPGPGAGAGNGGSGGAHGRQSIAVTSTAAGTQNMDLGMNGPVTTNAVPVVEGRTYTVMAAFRATTVTRTVRVAAHLYTAPGGFHSTSASQSVTDTTSGWTFVAAPFTVPVGSGIAWAAPNPIIASVVGSGETHYVDALGVFPGTRTAADWEIPSPTVERQVTSIPSISGLYRLGGNLLDDPQYELASPTAMIGQYFSATITTQTAEKRTGARALQVVTAAGTGNASGMIHMASDKVAVRPGEIVSCSVWAKGPAGQQVRFGVRWHNPTDGGYVGEANHFFHTFSGSWEQLAFTATQTFAVNARPGFQLYRAAAADSITYWIDDAVIEVADPLVDNGSFETDLSGWTATGGASINRDVSQFWWETASARIAPSGAGDAHVVGDFNIPGIPGQLYAVSFMAKADQISSTAQNTTTTTSLIGLQESSGGFRWVAKPAAAIPLTTSWTRFTYYGYAPLDVAPELRVILRGATTGTLAINAYFDDVQATTVSGEGIEVNHGIQGVSIPTAESVPTPVVLGGMYPQTIGPNASIAALKHQTGGNLILQSYANGSTQGGGLTWSASTLRARSGTGMLQTQVLRGANLLTPNQATVETDTTGWAGSHCSIARSTAQASDGAASLLCTVTSTASGYIDPGTTTATGGVMVTGSTQYSARLDFRAVTTGRSCMVLIGWFDAAGAFISNSSGNAVTDTTTGWVTSTVTATSPSNAVFANVKGLVTGPAMSEQHYVDKADIRHGAAAGFDASNRYYLVEPMSVTATGSTSPERIAVTPGVSMTLSGFARMLYAPASGAAARQFRMKAWYYDSSGVFVGALNSTTVTMSATGWTFSGPTTGNVPATAAYAVVVASYFSTSNILPGETFYVDDVTFEPTTSGQPAGAGKRLGFTGAANSWWSTPDRPELRISGEIDIRVGFVTTASGSTRSLLGKWQTNSREYRFDLGGSGNPQFYGNPDGTFSTEWSQAGTFIPSFSDGTLKCVRVTLLPDNGNNQHVVTFYTSADFGVTWTVLSSHTRAGVTSLHAGTSPLYLGSIGGGSGTQNFTGDIVFAEVRSGIDGPVVERFDARDVTHLSFQNPAFYAGGVQRLTEDQRGAKVPSAWAGNNASLKRGAGASVIDGTFNLRVTSTTTSAGWGAFITQGNSVQPVTPGKTYTAWFWATRGTGAHSMRASIEWRDSTGAVLSSSAGTTAALTTTPQMYTVTAQAPANAYFGMVNAYTTTTGAVNDSFDLDAAGFVEGGLWSPSPSAGSTWFWDMGISQRAAGFEHKLQSIIFAGPSSAPQMISTPDVAGLTVGDMELECEFTVPPGGLPNTAALISKWNDGSNIQKSFTWWMNTNGSLQLIWWDGAQRSTSASSNVPLVGGDRVTVKTVFVRDDGTGQHRVRFFRRLGGCGRWVSLGNPSQASGGGVSFIQDSTEPLTVGAYNGGTAARFAGKLHRAVMRNGQNGPIVALWDSEFTAPTSPVLPATGIVIPHGNTSTTWAITGPDWAWEYESTFWTASNPAHDTRHSTLAPPQGAQGFNVHVGTSDAAGAREGSISAGVGVAGSIDPTIPYTGLISQRLIRPLAGRANQIIKVNWASGVGYQGEMNSNQFTLSDRAWTDGHDTELPANATVDRADMKPWVNGSAAGEVWVSSAYALQPGEVPVGASTAARIASHDWEEVAPELTHFLGATSIPSAQSVPAPTVRTTIHVPSIRQGQNALRTRGGSYLSAPGDNLVSAVMSSFEAPSNVQGIVGIPNLNQATYSTTTEAWPNLLSNTGFETDTTGWSPSGGTPTISSSTDFALDGARSLKVVSTAAVSTQVITVATFPVVLGRSYTVKAWVRGGTVGRNCRVALNFRNAGGTLVNDANGNVMVSSTSWQESVAVGVPMDPTITQATVKLLFDSTVIGDTVYFDRVSFVDSTDAAPGVVDGVQAARIQSSGGSSWGPYEHIRGATGSIVVVAAGTQYTLSGWLTRGQGQYSVQARIEWRDSANATISTTAGTAVALSGVAQLASVTATAPANTTNATVTFYATSTGVAGDYFFADKVCFRSGTSTVFLDSYHPGLDLDVRVGFIPDQLTWTGGERFLIGKYNSASNKRSWMVRLDAIGRPVLWFSADGSFALNAVSTATLGSVGAVAGDETAVRATLQVVSGGNRVANFYYSLDDGGTWTPLGTAVTQAGALTNGLFRSDAPLTIGNRLFPAADEGFQGQILWAELLTSINGGRVFRFDTSDVDATAPQAPDDALVAV
jgi:Carbohydrate binding domain